MIGVRKDLDNGRVMTYPMTTHVRRPKRSTALPIQPLNGIDVEPSYWQAVDRVFAESNLLELRGTELPEDKEYISDVDAVLPGFSLRPTCISAETRSLFPEPATKPSQRAETARTFAGNGIRWTRTAKSESSRLRTPRALRQLLNISQPKVGTTTTPVLATSWGDLDWASLR